MPFEMVRRSSQYDQHNLSRRLPHRVLGRFISWGNHTLHLPLCTVGCKDYRLGSHDNRGYTRLVTQEMCRLP